MLENKTAIVTGGSGGLGEKICEALAAHGAGVAFTYNRNETKALKLREELSKRGGRALAARVGALDRPGIERFVEDVVKEFGRVDILVNNAGMTSVMPFAMIDEEDWDQVMDVNVKGVFLATKAAARHMIRQKSGSIVNLSSIAGQRLLEVPVHYAASKAALVGFTVSLAKELCRYGIRVNAVSPGFIDAGVGMNLSESQRAEYVKYCALGRAGRPGEVAELVAFLASDRASYINAQNITIDGGL